MVPVTFQEDSQIIGANSPLGSDPNSFKIDPTAVDSIARPIIIEALKQSPSNESIMCEALDLEGDLFSVGRNVTDLWNVVYGQPACFQTNGFGLLSIYTIYTGCIRTDQGLKTYRDSKKIDDSAGQAIGATNGARGSIEVMKGCSTISASGLSIIAMYCSLKEVVLASTVLKGASYGFSGLIYFLLAVPSLITLVKNAQFGKKMAQAMEGKTDPIKKRLAGLNALREELEGSQEEKERCLEKVVKNATIWDASLTEILDPGPIDFPSKLDEGEREFLLNEAIKWTSNPECARHLYGHFQKAYSNFKAKKEVDFVRKTGVRSLRSVREWMKLPSIEKGEEVMASVQSEMTKNKILHFALFFFCSLGLGLAIASGLGTTGLVIPIFWVILSLGMFAIDWHFLSETLELEKRDREGESRFFALNLLTTLLIGVGMSLGGGVLPLVFEGVWISAFALYFFYRLKKEQSDASFLAIGEEKVKEDCCPLLPS